MFASIISQRKETIMDKYLHTYYTGRKLWLDLNALMSMCSHINCKKTTLIFVIIFWSHTQQRDKDFLARLQKHRYSGFDQSKYEDDYYAEKVVTLSDYRQWIRQQQRKKETMKRLELQNKGTKETPSS